ncbi:MAG: hypothetical protein ABEJ55_06760 [Halanaeroarchaeum sp.]
MSRPSIPSATDANEVASHVSNVLSEYDALVRPIEAIGFWAAVAMPFVYLPLLATGLDTPSEGLAFAALVLVHVLALIVGRRHRSGP